MHFANCVLLAAVLFTTLIEKLDFVLLLRLGLFLNFEQKGASCSYKIVLMKKVYCFKGRVQCFSIQVAINKCFLRNPEKFGADLYCCFREKHKSRTL